MVTGPAHGTLTLNADGIVHLHAGRRTTTARTASPTRPTTARPTRNVGHGDAHGHRGERRAGGRPTTATTATEDTPLTVAADRRARQRHRRRRRHPDGACWSSGPAHGTLTLNAERVASPTRRTPNYNGPDSFTYKANDGTLDSQRRHGDDHRDGGERRAGGGGGPER